MQTIIIKCSSPELKTAFQNALNFYAEELQDFACGSLEASWCDGVYLLKD